MVKKIDVLENKTLKLQNVLSYEILLNMEDNFDMNVELSKMDIYIRTHGAKQVGPLIQFSEISSEVEMPVKAFFQADKYITNVVPPYSMESVRRVKNCLYARFIGQQDKIKVAYDKLNVYAYENEIELKGDVYTIFLKHDIESDEIVADIFMPLKD